MPENLLGGQGATLLTAIIIIAIALLGLVGVFWLIRNRAASTFIRGGKNRQPRLAVLDATAVDTRRRLVLIRRDDVEHLVMIGGPTDIVIESRIAQEPAQARPAPPQPQPPRMPPPPPRRRNPKPDQRRSRRRNRSHSRSVPSSSARRRRSRPRARIRSSPQQSPRPPPVPRPPTTTRPQTCSNPPARACSRNRRSATPSS